MDSVQVPPFEKSTVSVMAPLKALCSSVTAPKSIRSHNNQARKLASSHTLPGMFFCAEVRDDPRARYRSLPRKRIIDFDQLLLSGFLCAKLCRNLIYYHAGKLRHLLAIISTRYTQIINTTTGCCECMTALLRTVKWLILNDLVELCWCSDYPRD